MKSAILKGIKKIEIEDIPEPVLSDGEALVRIKTVGVCGSDVHYYLHGRIGNQVVKGPHILGHEPAGEVVKITEGVKNLKEGDRVAVEPGIPCENCEYCKSGNYNLCPEIKFLGTPPVYGAYREFINWPANFLWKLPDNMTYPEGSLVETMAVGMNAVELSHLKPGEDIAILGSGPVGIVTLKCALISGANRIFITDLIDERLNFVRKFNNVITINAKRTDPVKIINEMTSNRGVDIVFESAGSPETFRQSVEIVRIGGRVIWTGIPPQDYISIDTHITRRKGLTIKAVRRFKHAYSRCINLISSGKLNVKDMVTHNFNLEDIEKAFTLVENYKDGVIKAIINL